MLPSGRRRVPFGLAGLVQVPVVGLQVPAVWHWLGVGQVTGLVPVQVVPDADVGAGAAVAVVAGPDRCGRRRSRRRRRPPPGCRPDSRWCWCRRRPRCSRRRRRRSRTGSRSCRCRTGRFRPGRTGPTGTSGPAGALVVPGADALAGGAAGVAHDDRGAGLDLGGAGRCRSAVQNEALRAWPLAAAGGRALAARARTSGSRPLPSQRPSVPQRRGFCPRTRRPDRRPPSPDRGAGAPAGGQRARLSRTRRSWSAAADPLGADARGALGRVVGRAGAAVGDLAAGVRPGRRGGWRSRRCWRSAGRSCCRCRRRGCSRGRWPGRCPPGTGRRCSGGWRDRSVSGVHMVPSG